MSRTTLITNSFIPHPLHNFHFLYTCLPQPSAVHQFQIFELCRISVCTDVCLDFSLPEKSEGADYRRSAYSWERGPGTRLLGGLWAAPGASFLGSVPSQQTPSRAIPWGGSTKCRGGGGLVLCCSCLVSCEINTFLYIFREQKKKVLLRGSKFSFWTLFRNKSPQRSILNPPRSHLWICKNIF